MVDRLGRQRRIDPPVHLDLAVGIDPVAPRTGGSILVGVSGGVSRLIESVDIEMALLDPWKWA